MATPIMYGLPTADARMAAHAGELLLAGCLTWEDAPQWRCGEGHEWATTEAQWLSAIVAKVIDYEPEA